MALTHFWHLTLFVASVPIFVIQLLSVWPLSHKREVFYSLVGCCSSVSGVCACFTLLTTALPLSRDSHVLAVFRPFANGAIWLRSRLTDTVCYRTHRCCIFFKQYASWLCSKSWLVVWLARGEQNYLVHDRFVLPCGEHRWLGRQVWGVSSSCIYSSRSHLLTESAVIWTRPPAQHWPTCHTNWDSDNIIAQRCVCSSSSIIGEHCESQQSHCWDSIFGLAVDCRQCWVPMLARAVNCNEPAKSQNWKAMLSMPWHCGQPINMIWPHLDLRVLTASLAEVN